VDAHYVAYALRAEARAGYLAVQAGNVRQRSVDFRNWETLARIIVPLPDYAVQRELVDRLQRNLRQLNRIEQVYRELAVQAELRAAAMIAEIIDGPAIRLKHLVERVGSGKTPRGGAESYASSGVLFIRSTNVRRGYLDLTDAAYIDEEVDREMASSRVRPGDVLFNITGASIGRSTVAPSTLGPANVNQHVYLLRPNDGVSGVMLSAALNAPGVQGQIAVAQVGGNRDGLTSDQLGDIRLQWPRGEDASAAEASVVNIQSWVADMRFALVRQLDLLQERRQALITAAVTGQLEIPGVAA
jgi:restriction endonuclease S subunit